MSEASVRAMQEPQVEAALAPHWGIGWAVEEIDGVRLVGHGGTTNGFQARLTLVPARRFAFACLTNSNLGAATYRAIGDELLERHLGLRRQESPPVSLPAPALATFAGRYGRPAITVSIEPAADGLRIETWGKDPITKTDMALPARRAIPIGERTFRILDGEQAGSTFDFIAGAAGGIRYLRMGGRLLEPA